MSSPGYISIAQRLGIQNEQWRGMIYQMLCDLRVALPGTIQSFDSSTQTVEVRLAITENINQWVDNKPSVKPTELPILKKVPLVLPRAGNFLLTLPVQEGDECLVVFADMSIDAWWQNGGVQNQIDRRRHDFWDGFAILAPWNQKRKVDSYNVTDAELRSEDGTVKVQLKSDEVIVTAPKVTVTGSTNVHIDGNSATTIDGKNFLTHTHSGVTSGGGTSGPVT